MTIAATSPMSVNIVALESLLMASSTFTGAGGTVYFYSIEAESFERPCAIISEADGMLFNRGGLILGDLNIHFEADIDPAAENWRDAGVSFRNWVGGVIHDIRNLTEDGQYLIVQPKGLRMLRRPQRNAFKDSRDDYYDCLFAMQVGLS